jgi:hypothetical protein
LECGGRRRFLFVLWSAAVAAAFFFSFSFEKATAIQGKRIQEKKKESGGDRRTPKSRPCRHAGFP